MWKMGNRVLLPPNNRGRFMIWDDPDQLLQGLCAWMRPATSAPDAPIRRWPHHHARRLFPRDRRTPP
jgi:hypothetical protein